MDIVQKFNIGRTGFSGIFLSFVGRLALCNVVVSSLSFFYFYDGLGSAPGFLNNLVYFLLHWDCVREMVSETNYR